MMKPFVLLVCLIVAYYSGLAQQPAYTVRHFVTTDDPSEFIRLIPKGDGPMRTYLLITADIWDLDDAHTTYVRVGKKVLVCIEGPAKKGQRDGIYTAYVLDSLHHSTRYKIWEQTYSGNRLNGEWRVYSLSGTLVSTQAYSNDSLHGLSRTFWIDGKTVMEERQYLDGNATGSAKRYYPDGVLMDEVYLLNGLPHGIQKYYYPSGKLWIEQELKNGHPWTVLGNYTELGHKRPAGTLKDGNGTMILYDEDGSVRATVVYRNGVEQ